MKDFPVHHVGEMHCLCFQTEVFFRAKTCQVCGRSSFVCWHSLIRQAILRLLVVVVRRNLIPDFYIKGRHRRAVIVRLFARVADLRDLDQGLPLL